MRVRPKDIVLTKRGLRFQGRYYPCSIGRGGVSDRKREGDGATPSGSHEIVGLLYRPDRLAAPTDWARPIGPSDLWSDDPTDQDYNMMVRTPYSGRHERLMRADPLYDLIILTNWNWPYAVKGRGSAIFLHQWRRPHYPTEGCIGVSRTDLRRIAKGLRFGTKLVIA